MKQKIVKIFVTCYFLCSVCSYAQLQREWVQFYQGLNGSEGYALCFDDSGNVYVTGVAGTNDTIGYCTIKYSNSGIQQWVRNYCGTNNGGRYPHAIAIDNSSNVYVTGYQNWCGLPGIICFEYCTIKYSSQGIQQWIAEYRGIVSPYAQNEAKQVAVDNAGNIYVTGICDIAGSDALTTIKYSPNSDSIWVKRGEGVNVGQNGYTDVKMVIDNLCNIYIAYGSHNNFTNATTICLDSSGNIRWRQVYDSSECGGTAIAIDKNKNIYTGGWIWNSIGDMDYLLIKYSNNGLHLWHRRYHFGEGFGVDNYINSIVTDKNNDVIVSGNGDSTWANSYAGFGTVKYKSNGDLMWAKNFHPLAGGYHQKSMDIDSKDNIYITGSGPDTVNHHSSILAMKADNSGNLIGWDYYDLGYGYNLKVDNYDNVVVTGSAYNYYNQRMCTIKYSSLTGKRKISNESPSKFILYQNYPNPFNPITNFGYRISDYGFVILKIYDILGKEIITLVNDKLKPGEYKIKWDGTNYPSGVYFYQLKIFEPEKDAEINSARSSGLLFSQAKKCLLLK